MKRNELRTGCFAEGWIGLFLILGGLFLGSASASGAQVVISGFDRGTEGWSADSGMVTTVEDAAHRKAGSGALQWSYDIQPGGFNLLYKYFSRGTFSGMEFLSFWLKSDRTGILAVNVNEADGSTYQTYIRVRKGEWKQFTLPKARLLFDPESIDENRRLDLDQINRLTFGEIGGFTGGLKGHRNIWLDDIRIQVSVPSSASDTPLFGKDSNYSVDTGWLDARIKEWKPSKFHPMILGVDTQVFIGGGYLAQEKKNIESYAFAEEMLKVAVESGVEIIRIGALDDAWRRGDTREIVLADKLVAKIRESGLKLLMVDTQHSEYLSKHPVTWDQFRSIHLQRVKRFTRRYHPDFYVVVTEPSTYLHWGIQGRPDIKEWVRLTRSAAEAVKQIRPGTKTGICIDVGDRYNEEYYRRVLALQDLDIVGMEIYKPSQFAEAEALLSDHPHRHGKALWLFETWSGMPYPFTNVPTKEREDAKWIEASVYFAQRHQYDAYLVWPFQYFITYDRDYDRTGRVDYTGRTRPFSVFKKLVGEIGNSGGSSFIQ